MPVLAMLTPGKDATPATAATVVVPTSAPPPGLAPRARVTGPVNAVAVLPRESSAVTRSVGANGTPAVTFPGGTVKTSATMGSGPVASEPHAATSAASTKAQPGRFMVKRRVDPGGTGPLWRRRNSWHGARHAPPRPTQVNDGRPVSSPFTVAGPMPR